MSTKLALPILYIVNVLIVLVKYFSVFLKLIFQVTYDPLRFIDPTAKEITRNLKYEELFAPELGPENPFLTTHQKAKKNMLSGYVEEAHMSEFNFENQRRTFTSYGWLIFHFSIKF